MREYDFKDKEFLKWLHETQNCIVCGNHNIEVHHIKGMKQVRKRNDLMIIPLCAEHHRGKYSPHGADSDKFKEDYPLEQQMQIAVLLYSNYKKDVNG
jgi:hypothetical protein